MILTRILILSFTLFVLGCVKAYRTSELRVNATEYSKKIQQARLQMKEDYNEKSEIKAAFESLEKKFQEPYEEKIGALYKSLDANHTLYNSTLSRVEKLNKNVFNATSNTKEVISGKDPEFSLVSKNMGLRKTALIELEAQIDAYNKSSTAIRDYFANEKILVIDSKSFFKESKQQIVLLRNNYKSVRQQIDSLQKAMSGSDSLRSSKDVAKIDKLDSLLRTIPSRIQNLEVLVKDLESQTRRATLVILVKEDPKSQMLKNIKAVTKEIQSRGSEFNRIVKEIEGKPNQ